MNLNFGLTWDWDATSNATTLCGYSEYLDAGKCGRLEYCHIYDNYLQFFVIKLNANTLLGHWANTVDEYGYSISCDANFGDPVSDGDPAYATIPCAPCIGKDTVTYTFRTCEAPTATPKTGHFGPLGTACVDGFPVP